MNIGNGKSFTTIAKNYSKENIYIQSVKLNGKEWNKTYIPVEEIRKGGTIEYVLGSEPNMNWGTDKESVPPSISK